MNRYLSAKIKFISFFLMVMVVFLHSYSFVTKYNDQLKRGYDSFIQDFFSQGITRIAVPLFFLISGYLFFLNLKGTPNEFISKFKRRMKTLVFPYLFWSIWGFLLFLLLQNMPLTRSFFSSELIKNYSTTKLLYIIFLDPMTYQLWFVRDLIVLIFFSPAIFWLLKYCGYFILIPLLIAWVFTFDFIILSYEALFFFVLGAYFGLKDNKSPQLIFSRSSLIYTYLWITLVLIKTILIHIEFQHNVVIVVLHKMSILIGIIAVWSLYDILCKKEELNNNKFISFSFFLYVFHEPLLTILKKGFFFILGDSEPISLVVYVLAPIFTICIVLYVGKILKLIVPRFYGLITGGR